MFFHRTRRIALLAMLALPIAVLPAPAAAQEPPGAPSDQAASSYQAPPSVTVVDGSANLRRNSVVEPAATGMPVVGGDRLMTEGGRVEVLYPDGSLLHLDRHTVVDVLSSSLVRLLEGRIILVVSHPTRGEVASEFQVDVASASVRTVQPGEYQVALLSGAADAPPVTLHVVSGEAELFNERGSVTVRAGERAEASAADAPLPPSTFNSARLDAFEQWSDEQRTERMAARDPDLPEEIQPYASTLEMYGRWEVDPDYGRVWYPMVALDWRPYYAGYWSYVGPFGWTWIGYDPWFYPTHHFGRWGWRHNRWFWIPGRHWAPAWVAWAVAPGYVSWCPLGFDGRPVFSIFAHVGFSHGFWHDPWRAWTIVPRHAFGIRAHVARVAVHASTLPESVRTSFAVQRSSGVPAPTAVTRAGQDPQTAPIRRAVPRPGTAAADRAVSSGNPALQQGGLSRAVPRNAPSGVGSEPPAARSRALAPSGGEARSPATARSRATTPSGGESRPPTATRRTTAPQGGESRSPATVRPRSTTPSGGESRPPTATPRTTTPLGGESRSPATARPRSTTPSGGESRPPTARSRTTAPGSESRSPATVRPRATAPFGSESGSPATARPRATAPSGGVARPPSSAARPRGTAPSGGVSRPSSRSAPRATAPSSGVSRPSSPTARPRATSPSGGAGRSPGRAVSPRSPSGGSRSPSRGGSTPSRGGARPRR